MTFKMSDAQREAEEGEGQKPSQEQSSSASSWTPQKGDKVRFVIPGQSKLSIGIIKGENGGMILVFHPASGEEFEIDEDKLMPATRGVGPRGGQRPTTVTLLKRKV